MSRLSTGFIIYLAAIMSLCVFLGLGVVGAIGLSGDVDVAVATLRRMDFQQIHVLGRGVTQHCPLAATNRVAFAALTDDSVVVVGVVCTSTFIGHDTVVVYQQR